jgi:tetraacyldisaccharide 4'-kinase
MLAPSFWWRTGADPPAKLLAPIASVYGWAASRRIRRPGTRLPLPIICIGNFVVGGAGKTPAALALGRCLIACGEAPFFLSRGYRSRAERGGPTRVDASRHTAADVGDEALLLAKIAPTIVGADRVAGGRLALAQGASLLILDDGLQNPSLEKDLRLVLLDGDAGLGNGYCLPAGPLRAPLAAQMDLASAVIIVGEGAAGELIAARARAAARPVIGADLRIRADAARDLAGHRVYAFAGLALPQKFYASLAKAGAEIIGTSNFPDHHPYDGREIRVLQQLAWDHRALLVTTEKDIARLTDRELAMLAPTLPLPRAIPVTLEFADKELLSEIVAAALAAARRISSPAADQA